jgi:hypothetical protein
MMASLLLINTGDGLIIAFFCVVMLELTYVFLWLFYTLFLCSDQCHIHVSCVLLSFRNICLQSLTISDTGHLVMQTHFQVPISRISGEK